ncbi:hypothetical protein ABZX85_39825 [Streptomyces sp. NPDC004539]|uniref:hypothetical protein n=1 Tax=Streptomyces sp. NPDC004539 TaxID=3154280 RepID=UPI0033A12AA3
MPREEGGGWGVLERVGREVLGALSAEDAARGDELLRAFRADPQAMAGARRRPAVGIGTSVPDLAAYVFPAVAWVLGMVSQRVADSVMDVVGEATRRKVARLVEARRGRGAAGAGAESAPEGDDAVSEGERTALVTAFTYVFEQRLGLDGEHAQALAESVVAAMVNPRAPGAS